MIFRKAIAVNPFSQTNPCMEPQHINIYRRNALINSGVGAHPFRALVWKTLELELLERLCGIRFSRKENNSSNDNNNNGHDAALFYILL